MSVFFPPPRSGGPLRATRTGEKYLTANVEGNEWYEKVKQTVPEAQQTWFMQFVGSKEDNDHHVKDEQARKDIQGFADALKLQNRTLTRYGLAGAHNAVALNNEIKHAIDYVWTHNVDGSSTMKRLLKYEMRDGLDPTNRLLMCWRLPTCCMRLDEESLEQAYELLDEPDTLVLKYVIIVLLLLFYILAIMWLSYGMQTMYACDNNTPSLSAQGYAITDKSNGHALLCGDLLNRCLIPVGRMPLKVYYSVRIASYILCTIPLLFLLASPCVLSARMLAPLNIVEPSTDYEPHDPSTRSSLLNAEHVKNAEHCMNAIFCARESIQVSDFFDISAYWMLITHWAGGIFTLILDGATAQYMSGLSGACSQPWQANKTLAIDPLDDSCACSVLFGTPETRGLAKVSGLELMAPQSVAIALLIPNVIYTLWSFVFVLQVWQLRHLGNRDPPAKKKGSQKSSAHTSTDNTMGPVPENVHSH